MKQNGFEFANESKSLNQVIDEVKKSSMPTGKKVETLVKLGLSKADVWRFFNAPVTLPKAQRFSFTFGVEIECISQWERLQNEVANKEVPLQANVRFGAYTHRDSETGYKFVTDGSLGASRAEDGSGIECVSPVLRGKKGFDSLKNTCAALSDAGAKVNKSCGLHVHIGANGLTGEQYVNVFRNYQKLENVIDSFMAKSRRKSNAFYAKSLATFDFGSCHDVYDVDRMMGCRYFKVNPESYERHRTIEFRQHQGSINYHKIEMWVKFCAKLVNWSKDNVLPDVVRDIDDVPFLNNTEKAFFKSRINHFSAE